MEDAKKKCLACKTDIPFEATKCSHCGSDQPLSEHTRKVIGWIFIAFIGFFIGLFVLGSIGSSEPSKTAFDDPTKDWEELCNPIVNFIKAGNIAKVDIGGRDIYVNLIFWRSLNIEDKEALAKLSAYCVAREATDRSLIYLDIYDWHSGTKLGHYSDYGGFSN